MKESKNLSNIDFNDTKMRIETPHSRQAILELGLTDNDLFKISKQQYLLMYPELKTKSKDIQVKRYNHYEEKRKQAIDEAIKKREEIMSQEHNIKKEKTFYNKTKYSSNTNNNNNINIYRNNSRSHSIYLMDTKIGNSTLIKRELEKLNLIKKKEIGEIKNLIDY